MRSTTLLAGLIALTSTAFAASSDECQAQNIVDACVEGYAERIRRCQDKSNDWICMCDVYRDVLTCYNNCPDSNEKPPVQNQVTQYCTAAEPLRAAASSSAASAASVAKTATTASPTSASASATESGSGAATGSAATSTVAAFATGAASSLTTPAGAAVVALFAAAGLF